MKTWPEIEDADFAWCEQSTDGVGVAVYVRGLGETDDLRRACMRAVEDVKREVRRARALADPQTAIRASEVRVLLTDCFREAGLAPIYVEETPNEYWSHAPDVALCRPWLIVTSRLGRIRVGWRKHVIDVDWSDSPIGRWPIGSEWPGTVGDTHLHADNYQEVTRALRLLAAAFDKDGR